MKMSSRNSTINNTESAVSDEEIWARVEPQIVEIDGYICPNNSSTSTISRADEHTMTTLLTDGALSRGPHSVTRTRDYDVLGEQAQVVEIYGDDFNDGSAHMSFQQEQHPANRGRRSGNFLQHSTIEMVEIDGGYDPLLQPFGQERYQRINTNGIDDDHVIERVQIDGSFFDEMGDADDEGVSLEIRPRWIKERSKKCRKVVIIATLIVFIIFAGGYGRVLWTKRHNADTFEIGNDEPIISPRDKLNPMVVLTLSKWTTTEDSDQQAIVGNNTVNKLQITNGLQIFPEDEGREFGKRVAISGDGNVVAVAVGPRPNDSNDLSRKIQTYRRVVSPLGRNEDAWQYMGMPVETLHFDNSFGENIQFSFDGHRMVVSAPYGSLGDDTLVIHNGYAVVYDFDGSHWQQVGSTLEGLEKDEHFGRGLSISQDGIIIAVGSPNYNNDQGRVSIFRWHQDDWKQEQLPVAASDITFTGASLAVSATGNRLVVAGASPAGYSDRCHVQVYECHPNVTTWTLVGASIALYTGLCKDVHISNDGKMIVAGGKSSIRAFSQDVKDNDEIEWKQKGSFLVDRESYTTFDISGNGNRVVVSGACGGYFVCYLQVYDFLDSGWVKVGKSLRSPVERGDDFGKSVALSDDGTQIIVGAVDHTHSAMRTSKGYAALFSFSKPDVD